MVCAGAAYWPFLMLLLKLTWHVALVQVLDMHTDLFGSKKALIRNIRYSSCCDHCNINVMSGDFTKVQSEMQQLNTEIRRNYYITKWHKLTICQSYTCRQLTEKLNFSRMNNSCQNKCIWAHENKLTTYTNWKYLIPDIGWIIPEKINLCQQT